MAGYQHDNRDVTQTVKGSRLAAIRSGDGWRVAAITQYVNGLKDAGTVAPTSMTSWGVTGRYQLSSDLWLRGQVFARDYKDTNNESVLATIGVDRILSPKLTWYGLATATQNKAGAAASVTGGGYGDTMTVALGEDPFAISTGLIFKF